MLTDETTGFFLKDDFTESILNAVDVNPFSRIRVKGLTGSSRSLFIAALHTRSQENILVIHSDKESAAYLYNDLENIYREKGAGFHKKEILFFPTSYRRNYEPEKPDSIYSLLRTNVIKRLSGASLPSIVVSYPEAVIEKLPAKKKFEQETYRLKVNNSYSFDELIDFLTKIDYERVDFVYEPGQYSVRGGIFDIYSYNNDYPYRAEFRGSRIESLRTFKPADQLSMDFLNHVSITPNIQKREELQVLEPFFSFLPDNTLLVIDDFAFTIDRIDQENKKLAAILSQSVDPVSPYSVNEVVINSEIFSRKVLDYPVLECGRHFFFEPDLSLEYKTDPQPRFHKNFELLIADLNEHAARHYKTLVFSDNANQLKRIDSIFTDIKSLNRDAVKFSYEAVPYALHEGFIDHTHRVVCYTDHQIFERYHRFFLDDKYNNKEAITIKELYDLKPGDFVTHIDHGVGRFDGLEKLDISGREQEAIRLSYQNGDLLYVSIHSLHRISKFTGKEGTVPQLSRLGSNAWQKVKDRTKRKIKDIARDLIALYASRKKADGFAYSPDTYLQHELEASFIYQDTPDQLKSTQDIKKDMEASFPMDRLICGDVGFGKTEVAIRAAFKAVADSKQVALLVPTTILAMQHFKTFTSRLSNLPANVDYISRFRSHAAQKQILENLKSGKTDIIIGTHRLLANDIQFKDLGLLIIDEEQKFGVSAKEKLRKLKVNVDTLTLTATPIPRTLQFSLMGARDLSVINTPPPDRYPVQTEIHTFGEEIIAEAVNYELSRGGQVFFVHNRIQNLPEIARLISDYCLGAKVVVAHGQMEGAKLEKIMVDFIEGSYDVLVSTTIIEAGLDIPNVNTMIINDAHMYGLSDLHQLRGRVGRSNRKAFCYLLAPPLSLLTDEARKRLKAIEEFSNLGSGFHIAMRDLDIRGAGNILGAEQSGFISDIGYEMYHKILDEALHELKSGEFAQLLEEPEPSAIVKDCIIETDLSLLIPDDYITNITERLSLYKELDSLETDLQLQQFRLRLIDRFGPLPQETEDLVQTMNLRRIAAETGFEKIIMKYGKLSGYFISDQESPFFKSEQFNRVLGFIKKYSQQCRLKQTQDRLILSFFNINNVQDGMKMISALHTECYPEYFAREI